MDILKKLITAPLAILAFFFLVNQVNPLLSSYDLIFSFSWQSFLQLIILASTILAASVLFNLFASLAQDFKLILPIGLACSFLPMLLLRSDLAVIFSIGTLVSLLISYIALDSNLRTYITFSPSSVLGPSIRHLASLLIVAISIIYFLSINQKILKEGFQIPDSLIDTALKIASPNLEQSNQTQQVIPKISKEQLEALKQNPKLLEQYGLDPKVLDRLSASQENTTSRNLSSDLIKETLKTQIQNFISPYKTIIPLALAVILFLTIISLVSVLTLFIYPILMLTFYILEKLEFVKFVTETRTVKKMVV